MSELSDEVAEKQLQRILAYRRQISQFEKRVEDLETQLAQAPSLQSIDDKLNAIQERLYNKEERRPPPQQYDERARFWLFLKETGNTDKYIEFYAPPETRDLFTQLTDMRRAIDELLSVYPTTCDEGCVRGNQSCAQCKWRQKWGPRIR